jgi:hypothetical protein
MKRDTCKVVSVLGIFMGWLVHGRSRRRLRRRRRRNKIVSKYRGQRELKRRIYKVVFVFSPALHLQCVHCHAYTVTS